MNALGLVQLALMILQAVLSNAKASDAAQEVVAGIEAAIAKLTEVHDTPVTMEQLESLRIEQLW